MIYDATYCPWARMSYSKSVRLPMLWGLFEETVAKRNWFLRICANNHLLWRGFIKPLLRNWCHIWTRNLLTHWGRVTHICVGKLIIIGSDNGLSPGRRQAIIWTNAGIWLMGPLGTNFSEILIISPVSEGSGDVMVLRRSRPPPAARRPQWC